MGFIFDIGMQSFSAGFFFLPSLPRCINDHPSLHSHSFKILPICPSGRNIGNRPPHKPLPDSTKLSKDPNTPQFTFKCPGSTFILDMNPKISSFSAGGVAI